MATCGMENLCGEITPTGFTCQKNQSCQYAAYLSLCRSTLASPPQPSFANSIPTDDLLFSMNYADKIWDLSVLYVTWLGHIYGGLPIIATGDPAGVRRSETDEVTAYMILGDCGINAKPARTNSFLARFNAVDSILMKLVGGKAAFQLDKRCKVLHKGFLGEYKFRRLKVTGDDRYVDSPDKNEYSHPHDALQYAAMLAESGFDQLRSLFAGGSQYSNRRPATPISTWY
jgi:hypothetical protein